MVFDSLIVPGLRSALAWLSLGDWGRAEPQEESPHRVWGVGKLTLGINSVSLLGFLYTCLGIKNQTCGSSLHARNHVLCGGKFLCRQKSSASVFFPFPVLHWAVIQV